MNVFNLFAKLTLDRSGYEKELNQAEKDTVQASDNIQDSLDESGKSFSKLGEIVAILRSPIDGFKEGLEESREEQELSNKQLLPFHLLVGQATVGEVPGLALGDFILFFSLH